MAAPGSDINPVQIRLRNTIYLYPMQRRVQELTNILEECNIKDIQNFFRFLVEHIFGVNPSYGNGWNLLRTSRQSNMSDFDALFRFLHPCGPLFDIIYKLLGDVYFKFEYPFSFLSARLRQIILEGSIPPFYIDKLKFDPHLREYTGLVLNAFEFYLFHFAYHLINSWQVNMETSFFCSQETVYLYLSDQYLQSFLPIETSVVLPHVQIHQSKQLPRSPPPPQAQPQKTPKLFKNSVIKHGCTSLSPSSVTQPHAEIWRSETFIQIIIYFWLSVPEHSFTSTPPHSMKLPQRMYKYPIGFGNVPNFPVTHYYHSEIRTAEDNLPKEIHLRVVRNMIKHIYYFVNNIHNDRTAMDELRKEIINLCRRPLYIFLRRHIHHWPLDSSFLLILETYLSFIQPWRYVKYNSRGFGESTYVDGKWVNFIVENFPAYTILVREIIPRFSRMDLTSPKHAHMLFRLTKVMSQPNLVNILKDIEGHLDDVHLVGHLHVGQCSPLASPKSLNIAGTPTTPTHSMSLPFFNRTNFIIQEIQELECPNFQYKTLFGQEFQAQVFELVLYIQQSLCLVKCLINSALTEQKVKNSSFFHSIKNFFLYTATGDDYTIDERQKTITYLEHSITYLSQIFDLNPPQLPPDSRTKFNVSNVNLMSSHSIQKFGPVDFSVINPKVWEKRTKLIRYEANPDLEPIRSTEITFLVRLLHDISTRINERYGNELKELWEREDIWGCVARQLLAPPCKFYDFDKSVPGKFAPRVSNQLPTRVCLRTLASHQTLSYIFLSGVLAFCYGYPVIPFYLFIFFLFVCLIFVRAFIERSLNSRQPPSPCPQQEATDFVPLDVSFQD